MNTPYKKLILAPTHQVYRDHLYAIHSRDDQFFLIKSKDIKRRRYIEEYLPLYQSFPDAKEADSFIQKDLEYFVKDILIDSLAAYTVLLEEEKPHHKGLSLHILKMMMNASQKEIMHRFIIQKHISPLSIDLLDYPFLSRISSYETFIKQKDQPGATQYLKRCLHDFKRTVTSDETAYLTIYASLMQYTTTHSLTPECVHFITAFEDFLSSFMIDALPPIHEIIHNPVFTKEEKQAKLERIIHITYNLKCEADGPTLTRLLHIR